MTDVFIPEVARLLRELGHIDTSHDRRSAIGERLCAIGDPRPGVSLRSDDLPDLVWCTVPGGAVPLERVIPATFYTQPFYIAKYPITSVQFQAFLDDPDGFERDEWWKGLPVNYHQNPMYKQHIALANYPRDTVSWYQSVAFCRWLNAKLPSNAWPDTNAFDVPVTTQEARSYFLNRRLSPVKWEVRLPTEWEWQQAANGGNPANTYPWGPNWDDKCANTSSDTAGRSGTTAVGMYPHGISPIGALDMAGNVFEWCLNEFERPSHTDTTDIAGRVLRGGSWSDHHYRARCIARYSYSPTGGPYSFGFRVVCATSI